MLLYEAEAAQSQHTLGKESFSVWLHRGGAMAKVLPQHHDIVTDSCCHPLKFLDKALVGNQFTTQKLAQVQCLPLNTVAISLFC